MMKNIFFDKFSRFITSSWLHKNSWKIFPVYDVIMMIKKFLEEFLDLLRHHDCIKILEIFFEIFTSCSDRNWKVREKPTQSKLCAFVFLHCLDALVPTFDDLSFTEGKCELAATTGRVELSSFRRIFENNENFLNFFKIIKIWLIIARCKQLGFTAINSDWFAIKATMQHNITKIEKS